MTHLFSLFFPKKVFLDYPGELTDEREAVESAMIKATENGTPQTVTVGRERFVVADPGRAGREIKPLR